MAREGLSRHNVVAAYPDMQGARKAIDALQFGGIEARNISLLGAPAEQAERMEAERTTTVAHETPVVWRVVSRALGWGAAGALVGLILGGILGGIGIDFSPIGNSPGAQILSWALYGVIAGALIGAYSAITVSEAWDLTFEPVEGGRVLVGVHSDDETDVAHAAEILQKKEALSIARFDEEGNPER